MSPPLDTIRVVDLSTGIAGPIAAMLLADFGADVVKVELPTGDPARSLPGFAVWNRNKRSIVVERDTAAGQERLARLLAGADLCILSEPSIADDPWTRHVSHLTAGYLFNVEVRHVHALKSALATFPLTMLIRPLGS